MQISGKTALVTGGGSGLGAATARRLAAEGALVIVVDRDADAATAVAQEVGGIAATADVTDETAIANALNAASATPQIIVNCAGIGTAARVVGREGPMSLDAFRTVINVNLVGTFNVCRLAAARMAEAGLAGTIVNTASVAAMDGQVGQCAYSASKAGVVGMSLPAARELSRHGVRVMAIAPGVFETPMMSEIPDEAAQALAASVPFPKRLGKPDEFARLAEQIITNAMLNGEVIRLDGGIRMQ